MFEIGQLTRLPLGYVGENGTRTISIDMKAWLDEYPGALVMIQVIRPVDHYKYPAAYTKTDGVIHWTVDGSEVMYAGKGFAQISLYNPDTKQEYKSRVVGTVVADSIDGFNDILLEETDPASKWVNRVLEAAESAEASKNDAANSKEEAAAAIAIVATQKNEALIAIQNEGAAQVVSVNQAGTQQAQFVEAKGEEVLGMIPEDYAELSKNVAALTEDIARNTATPIIPTATGEIVAVSDSANRPLAGLRLYGKTTQDGTPTPSAPVPLVNVGDGGSIGVYARSKNLLNIPRIVQSSAQKGLTITSLGGGFSVKGTAEGNAAWAFELDTPIPAGRYMLHARNIGISATTTLYFADADGTDFGHIPLNSNYSKNWVSTQKPIVRLKLYVPSGTTIDARLYPMLTVEDTDTWEGYKDGGNVSASTPDGLPGVKYSEGNHTDTNGQKWACVVRDYGHGVDESWVQKIVLNGSENITYDSDAFNVPGVVQTAKAYLPGLCSHYPVATDYSSFASGDYAVCNWANGALRIRDGGNTDVASFKARLAADPVTLYIPLATPIETPIPADELAAYRAMMSQYPTTTVYNDAGAGMAVDYIADTRNYIDQRISALLNA